MRSFEKTDMQLSIVELGVLLTHYKSFFGHLSSEGRGKTT